MTSITSPLKRGGADRLADIDVLLDSMYGAPEADLGNQPDPLEEAIYIILSFQTDLARFKDTWSKLRMAYRSWAALERASVQQISSVLREGGLHKQKARTIRRFLASVRELAGELSLDFLREMSDTEAERILMRLPGLSWKGARCVLLYSLGRDAFPIDSNTFRILKRTGVVSRRAVYRRRVVHDTLQAAVPAFRRRALHVNLVVHGQRTCLPRDPLCRCCPLLTNCPQIGVAPAVRRGARDISITGLRLKKKISKEVRSA